MRYVVVGIEEVEDAVFVLNCEVASVGKPVLLDIGCVRASVRKVW